MINSIIRLIFRHEALRQYNKNRAAIYSSSTFDLLGKIAWSIIILTIIASLTFNYYQGDDKLIYFIVLLITPIAFFSFFRTLFKYFKKKKSIYNEVPIYKPDRRFKTGQKQVGYKNVIIGYELLNNQELAYNKRQQGVRLILYGLIYIIGNILFWIIK